MADRPLPRRSKEITSVERPTPLTPGNISDPTIGGAGASASSDVPPGRVIAGRYRVLELLGAGGMGAVYRARDLTLGADVAIKRLDPALADDPSRVDTFRNEVLLARRVTHANVCRLHDIVEDGDNWFITMEYVEGETLADRLRRDDAPAIDLDVALRVIRDVASGLAAAHEVGVVHRDLKPGNVLLAADGGRAVIADFGIAVEINQLGPAVVDRAGTRGYMSPEQAAGGEIDARTDVFALGVLAHRMLAGELPPVAPTTVAHTEESEPPAPIPGSIPAALAALIARCLRRDPAARYADARALLDALDSIDAPPARARRWPRLAAGVAITAALAAIAGVKLSGGDPPLHLAAPRQVVIDGVDATAIDGARGDWIAAALGRRLANELDDAWGLDARLAADPGPEPRAIDATARLAVRADPRGLTATVAVTHRDGTTDVEVNGATLQELVEAAAAELVRVAVPASMRRPTPADLTLTGTGDPEAWRLVRRSQRASLRQLWPLARVLSKRALDLDPDSVAANLEHAMTFGGGDPGALPFLRAAVEAGDRGLSVGWSRAIAWAAATLGGKPEVIQKSVADTMAADLQYRERWYFLHRVFYGQWYDGYREDALSHLEQLEASYPRFGGASKLLANHFLARDDREAREQALRHARIAVARAPDDVASRAELARALLWTDEHSEALEQLKLIEAADEHEKLEAVAGGEETNSLFDLYMAIGDFAGADRAARRLETGNASARGHAHQSRALLRLFRGDEQGGLERLERAVAAFEEGGTDEFRTTSRRKLAAVAFALGKSDRVIVLVDAMTEYRLPYYLVMAAISRYREDRDRAHLARAEAMVGALSDEHTEKAFLGVLLAAERGDWKRVRGLEDGAVRWRRHLPARYLLGVAREKTGDLAGAAEHHEKLAYHRYGWSTPIWTNRSLLAAARLRAALGQVDQARAHYKRYLERLDRAAPSHAGVAEARRGLAGLEQPGDRR